MQKILRLITRLIVARHECTHVRHCKENAPIYMYYVAQETPMMSSVIADCPDLVPPPQYFGQVYASDDFHSIDDLQDASHSNFGTKITTFNITKYSNPKSPIINSWLRHCDVYWHHVL